MAGVTKILLKWHCSVYSFISGFRMLPSFWGTVYRCVCGISLDTISSWCEKDKIILFEGFTSTSSMEGKARNFVCEENSVLFIIESRTGRAIEKLSFFPEEKEVVFRPWTSFRVLGFKQVQF